MVVDAVIQNWVMLVSGEEARTEGFGQGIQWLVDFFYANDGLLVYPRTDLLLEALNVLKGLFNRVGL